MLNCVHILFREETGEDAYDIPVGGSNTVGFFGYIECIKELESQVPVMCIAIKEV